MMTLGMRMRTEFKKPTRTPPQFRPVQADDQALSQAANPGAVGSVKIEKVRTSSDVLNEVEITTSSGIEKNRQLARRPRRGHSHLAYYVSIVLPMLRPLIVTCLVLIAIAVVRSYDLVVAMTNGGPGFSSDLPGKFVVDFEFERANIGQASAAATVMLGSMLAVISPYLYFELARKNR